MDVSFLFCGAFHVPSWPHYRPSAVAYWLSSEALASNDDPEGAYQIIQQALADPHTAARSQGEVVRTQRGGTGYWIEHQVVTMLVGWSEHARDLADLAFWQSSF